jgi:purine-binding chemotaxis protein CheW
MNDEADISANTAVREHTPAAGGAAQFLTFILAGEEYGVDILRVQEIRGWTTVTQIPRVPDYVKGVINLRGTIVPIVDLRRRFRMEEIKYGPTTVVIVLKILSGDCDRVMGIVVDAVSDVYNVNNADIRPAPDIGSQLSLDFVRGLASVNDKMVIVLDIEKLLNVRDLDTGAAHGGALREQAA